MKKRFKQIITAWLALCLTLFPSMTVHADTPDCSAGKAQNIVAHPDDDLFFINPSILHDIQSGMCEQTIYATSGDAGRDQSYWGSREQGLRVAYANMAGVENTWTITPVTVLGHTVQIETLNQRPGISIVFMRLPNGGSYVDPTTNQVIEGYPSTNYETMKKLWENSITEMHPVDGSPAYARQELIDVLAVLMAEYGPQSIRTLDYAKGFDSSDHLDHQAIAYFAQVAQQQSIVQSHSFTGFEGYPVTSQPVNVSGIDLTNKQNAYFLYDAYDSNTCTSVSVCQASEYPYRLDWLDRSYTVGTPQTGSTHPWYWETVEGDPHSLSGYDANVGQQPASITFNNALYSFYYDATAGTLRYAKHGSDGSWSYSILDGQGGANGRITANVGQSPTVTIYNNTIQLFYYDVTHGALRHAYSNDGTQWTLETLDGQGGFTGLNDNLGQTPKALVYGTSLQLFYYDATTGDLRHAYSNDTGWHFENLDGANSIAGYSAAVGQNVAATVYGTTLQLFYYDATHGALRHAYSNDTGWHFENLDGANSILGFSGNTGLHPTVVVNGDVLNVFYYDTTHTSLRHAWTSTTQGWLGENLMGDSSAVIRSNVDIGIHSSAIVDAGGVLHLFAYEQSNGGGLSHIWQDSNGWHEEQLDGFGITAGGSTQANTGQSPDPIIFNNHLNVFYYDATNGNLRHIWQ